MARQRVKVTRAAAAKLKATTTMEATVRAGEKAAAKAARKLSPKGRTATAPVGVSRPAFAPNLTPRAVGANIPAGTMVLLGEGRTLAGGRTITLLNRSSPPSAAPATARAKTVRGKT